MQLILNIKTLPPWTAAHSVCRSMFFDCCMLVTSFHYIDENWDIQSSEFIFPLLDLIKLCQALLTVSSAMSSHWCVVGRMIKNSIKGWSLSGSLADRWFQFSSGFRDIPIGSHSHVNLFSFVKVMTTLILIIIDWIVSAWLWSGLCDGSVRGRNVCWLRRKCQPVFTATSRPWAGGEEGRWVTRPGSPGKGISDLHRS